MFKKTIALVCAVLLLVPAMASACTTIIVGREVSADGSFIFGRTGDTHIIEKGQIVTVPAQTLETPVVFVDEANGFTMELPLTSYQYVMTPMPSNGHSGIWAESALNEYNVAITATETIEGKPEALEADPYVENGIAESNIPTLVIPYVKTAEEGIRLLGSLVTKYGSAESNGVVIADPNEAWYIEIYTGHQWLAIKLPEDKVAVIPNEAVIGCADVSDTENVIATPDFWDFARDNDFLVESDGQPHAAKTYGADRFDPIDLNGSQYRFWGARHFLAPSQTGDIDLTAYYDMFFVPDEKVTIADCMELMRYRYEDTPYSTDENPQYRPIGVNYTETAHLFWFRKNLPVVEWVALANPEFSVFLPLYGNLTSTPEAYTNESLVYSQDVAYFCYRGLSNLCVEDRERYGTDVRAYWKAMETLLIGNMTAMDQMYLDSGCDGDVAAALFAEIAEDALSASIQMFNQVMYERIARMAYTEDDFHGSVSGPVKLIQLTFQPPVIQAAFLIGASAEMPFKRRIG